MPHRGRYKLIGVSPKEFQIKLHRTRRNICELLENKRKIEKQRNDDDGKEENLIKLK